MDLAFSKDFRFGATVLAHQVEGGNFANDWWRWEQRPGRIAGRATSKVCADHYHRFCDDVELARKLGIQILPVAVEWSRIQPQPDCFDDDAIAHYTEVFRSLRNAGIEPFCILWAVTLPEWLVRGGGWHGAGTVGAFERFVQRVVPEWAKFVKRWIPLYQPVHYLDMAYRERKWPSGRRNPFREGQALTNMAAAHLAACRAIRTQQDDALIGAALRVRTPVPDDPDSPWDLRVSRHEAGRAGDSFLDLVQHGHWRNLRCPAAPTHPHQTVDFIAVTEPGHEVVRFNPFCFSRHFAAYERGTAGRSVAAQCRSLHETLRRMANRELPIYILNDGCPAHDDGDRCCHLLDMLAATHEALASGIDVRAYIYGPLLDGFNWTDGFVERRGLIHVDWETLARTPNTSAFLLKEIAERRRIDSGLVARFKLPWKPWRFPRHEET